MSDHSPPWYVDAFRGAYLEVYAHRDDAAAAGEAAFAARLAGVAATDRVLDAGAGAGRHARALARLGARVTALDLSFDLLRAGARQATPESPRYVRGDLRRLPFREAAFDQVLSFFTSFGYFDDDGNRTQLEEVRRVLRPGGRYVLDFLNAPRIERTLVPQSERNRDGTRIVESRRLREGRVEKDVRLEDTTGQPIGAWRESVRLYARGELEEMLAGARLSPLAAHGDLAGGPWSPAADRLVLLAEAR